jgi:two-component system OmpR family sensor kinase
MNRDLRRAAVRLSVQMGVILLTFALVLGALVFFVVSQSQQAAAVGALYEAAEGTPRDTPTGVYFSVLDGGRWMLPVDAPAGLPDESAVSRLEDTGADQVSEVTTGEDNLMVLTTRERGVIVQVAINRHEDREELDRLLGGLLLAGGLALVLATALAAWLARRAIRPLADALALQRRFIADASHELRTPLTLLSTRAQLLRRTLGAEEGVAGDATRSRVDEMVEDAKALGDILDDLLIASDPRRSAETEIIDLPSAADRAVDTLRTAAEERGITLTRAGQPGVVVHGSRVPIQRMFSALISNALDYARTEVTVSVSAVRGSAVITVRDDGPGFSAGDDERMFERFASDRVAGSPDDEPRHYGLGLALVAEIAAQHGGRVRADRVQDGGGGAQITVELPRAAGGAV